MNEQRANRKARRTGTAVPSGRRFGRMNTALIRRKSKVAPYLDRLAGMPSCNSPPAPSPLALTLPSIASASHPNCKVPQIRITLRMPFPFGIHLVLL